MEGRTLHERLQEAYRADGRRQRDADAEHEQTVSPQVKAARAAAFRLIEKLLQNAASEIAAIPGKPEIISDSNDTKVWLSWAGTTSDTSIRARLNARFSDGNLQLDAFVETPANDDVMVHRSLHRNSAIFHTDNEAAAADWLETEFIACAVRYRRAVP